MPSHPDRVRKNYEPRQVIHFKNIPIHICDKAPVDPPLNLLNIIKDGICPFCLEKVNINVS